MNIIHVLNALQGDLESIIYACMFARFLRSSGWGSREFIQVYIDARERHSFTVEKIFGRDLLPCSWPCIIILAGYLSMCGRMIDASDIILITGKKDFRGLSKCDPHTPDLREKCWSPQFFLGPLAEKCPIHTCMFGQFVSPVTLVIRTFMNGGVLSQ